MPNRMLNKDSLAMTLWNLEKARLNGIRPKETEIDETLKWIVNRQKEPGRFGLGFAAPTEHDYSTRRLPTGEKIHSRAGAAHLLGEEAFWALAKWCGKDAPGLRKGLIGMLGRASRYPAYADKGKYCCGSCSLAFWRALVAAGIKEGESFVERGLLSMNLVRDGKLGWNTFPFSYSIYALASLNHPIADEELKYAQGRIERSLRLLRISRDPYGLRKLGFEYALERL